MLKGGEKLGIIREWPGVGKGETRKIKEAWMPGSATWISFHGHWELWKSFAEGKWDLSTIFQNTEFIITMILIAKGEGNTNNKSIHHMSKVKGCHSHDYVALFMTLYQRVGGRDPPASLDEADCLLVKCLVAENCGGFQDQCWPSADQPLKAGLLSHSSTKKGILLTT